MSEKVSVREGFWWRGREISRCPLWQACWCYEMCPDDPGCTDKRSVRMKRPPPPLLLYSLLSVPTCPPCHLPPARCLLCTHDRPWHPLLLVPFFQFHWLFLFGNPTDHFATLLGHRLRFHGPHWLHRLLLFHRLSGPRDIINQLITTFINKLSPTKVSWSLPCSMIKDILTSGACLLFLAGQKMGKSCSPRSPVSSARTLDSRVRRGSSLSTMFALHQQWKI